MTLLDPFFGAPEEEAVRPGSWEPFPPFGAMLVGDGVVIGTPRPGGSKDRFTITKAGPDGRRVPVLNDQGMPMTRVVDQSARKGGKEWREAVREQVMRILRLESEQPLDCPLVLEVVFFRAYGVSDFGSGRNADRLKGSARAYPSVAPDATKLLRAFEDALNKRAWSDDSRITDVLSRKRYDASVAPQERGKEWIRAEWRLWRLPATVEALREAQGVSGEGVPASAGKPVTVPADSCPDGPEVDDDER